MDGDVSVRLVAACEAGALDEVRKLLARRVNPDLARKHVTLKCRLDKGDTRTDTIFGESCLALAIIHERSEVVKLLLEAGASPNLNVTWRLSHAGKWDVTYWNENRWHFQYRFSSGLLLALGKGARVSLSNCHTKDHQFGPWQTEAETQGLLRVNHKGGVVVLDHPMKIGDQYKEVHLKPSLEIVRPLLNAGALVTDEVMEALLRLGEPSFTSLVHAHITKHPEARVHVAGLETMLPGLGQLQMLFTPVLDDTDDTPGSTTPDVKPLPLQLPLRTAAATRPPSQSSLSSSGGPFRSPTPREALALLPQTETMEDNKPRTNGSSVLAPSTKVTFGAHKRVPSGGPAVASSASPPTRSSSILKTPSPKQLNGYTTTNGIQMSFVNGSNRGDPALHTRYRSGDVLPGSRTRPGDPVGRSRTMSGDKYPRTIIPSSSFENPPPRGSSPKPLPPMPTSSVFPSPPVSPVLSQPSPQSVARLVASQLRASEDLRNENSTLQSRLSLLSATHGAETAHLHAKVAELERELAALKGVSDAVANNGGQHWVGAKEVKRLMWVAAEFQPRDVDEMGLQLGDQVFVNVEYPDGWASVSFAQEYSAILLFTLSFRTP
ncbi:hypothetical protein M427DRAFT_39489 [Gonapodya prolifera JEL478]|uniref:Uncharacterized protein n=1 Tax=Gonapodya prolifera (strain JEL478) TaxID=1344416 RepID=A0A138ZYD2_GONPJ|nr:hypothetical protein M427DRAFT_39489 [Gonapodya prolifera JEL478]|eukprot:KXS09123.1 hypothetical protein M427DRAFT_39489 [Gonapodya prolifera JEL478]